MTETQSITAAAKQAEADLAAILKGMAVVSILGL